MKTNKNFTRFIQGFSIALMIGFVLGLNYGRDEFTSLCETSFNGEVYEDFSGVYCCADWNDTELLGTNYCKSQRLVEYELPLMKQEQSKGLK